MVPKGKMSRVWNEGNALLERVAIRKSQLLNGEADRRHRGSGRRRFTQKRNVRDCCPRVADVSDEEEQPFSVHSALG